MKKFVKKADYGLHQYVPNCTGCDSKGTKCNYTNCQERIYARLAAYEATGYTPEDITVVLKQNAKLCKQLASLRARIKVYCVDCSHIDEQQCENYDFECGICPSMATCACKECENGSEWEWKGTPHES